MDTKGINSKIDHAAEKAKDLTAKASAKVDEVVGKASSLATEAAKKVEELAEKVGHIYGYVANHFSGHSPATAREFQYRLGQTPVDPDLLGEQMSLF